MHVCTGEGNGNPLQYSCLENPRDGGAWWAALYGVTQSWTQLKRLSSSSSSSSKVNIGAGWLRLLGVPLDLCQGVRTQLHPLPPLTSVCSIPRGESRLAHRSTSLLRVDWPLRWPGPHPQEVKLPGWRCWRCGVWPGRHEYESTDAQRAWELGFPPSTQASISR